MQELLRLNANGVGVDEDWVQRRAEMYVRMYDEQWQRKLTGRHGVDMGWLGDDVGEHRTNLRSMKVFTRCNATSLGAIQAENGSRAVRALDRACHTHADMVSATPDTAATPAANTASAADGSANTDATKSSSSSSSSASRSSWMRANECGVHWHVWDWNLLREVRLLVCLLIARKSPRGLHVFILRLFHTYTRTHACTPRGCVNLRVPTHSFTPLLIFSSFANPPRPP